MSDTLAFLRALDALFALAGNATLAAERYMAMRKENGDQPLSEQQLLWLEKSALAAHDRNRPR
jgi:hypothetical protein